jgi:hypothetical protein
MTLAPHHYAMLHTGSALSDEVITERGYATLDGPTGYDDLKRLGFSTAQAKLRPGLLLPLHTTDGTQPLTVYRPDHPGVDAAGKIRKYLLPKGARMRLDCPPRCRPGLADPQMPLWITEGQKKADCLASHGAVALALLGVWNFKGKNDFAGTTVLVDFDYVAWQGREVRIVFDSDILQWLEVRQALERLTEILHRKHAAVRAVYLPADQQEKVGVDDYLVAGHTLQDLEALIDLPRPKPQATPAQVELLDQAPLVMSRPLALIAGRSYAAIWPHVKVTRTETLDKLGNIVRLPTPAVTTEQRLCLVRQDGVVFGDGMDQPLSELELEVHLPEIPPRDKLWTVPGVKAYRTGARPDPADVFRRVVAVIDRFLDFDRSLANQETMCELVACYTVSTWFLDALNVIGYLWPNGGPGSGKTKLLTLVAELSYLGQVILAGGSYASLRDLADYGATLGFDDAENVMDLKRGDPDKRALLLAGNRRGNTVSIKEPVNGREWRTRHVHTFCPRLFSAIRLPDPVLASRTIIVPLIRSVDKDRANAEVLEYGLWPYARDPLLSDLWALALSSLTHIPAYEAAAVAETTLAGRLFEPWRAIMTVAGFLQDHGVDGLTQRMTALATAYQEERPTLEPQNFTPWVLQAICQYCATSATNATNATSMGSMGACATTKEWIVTSSDLKDLVITLAQDNESGVKPENISTDRIGRVLGGLRFTSEPRVGNRGPRKWRINTLILHKTLLSYGLPLPTDLFPPENDPAPLPHTLHASGTSGASGASGAHTPGAAHGLPAVGDLVTPLAADGCQIPANGVPFPYLITAIELGPDGQQYARFMESATGWPLAQCHKEDAHPLETEEDA